MNIHRQRIVIMWVAICSALLVSRVVEARRVVNTPAGKDPNPPSRVLVLDGTTVHNVGRLQMHLLNWGEWGSRPGTGEPYSFAPSAQWPTGSGVEYLFSAGLWVGAVRNGIPAVSTASFDNEFRPAPDPRDIVYRTREGASGGNRLPSILADDDGDGLIDEDRLDGYDNDGDGLVDEDFAAISRLMLTCKYNDDEPVASQIYSDHNPLRIVVQQQSYQWDGDRFADFVAVEYRITNAGDDLLQDVYVGMFVDADAGPIDRDNYWQDDLAAHRRPGVVCTDLGPVTVDVAYMFDDDGDGGETPGYFGVTFLNHPTDPAGLSAPATVGIASYAHFAGRQSFLLGGDPVNDFERYEILARNIIEADGATASDYRFLVSAGPFAVLVPDSTLVVQLAFAIGEGEEQLLATVANAQAAFAGTWFDLDGDPSTGAEGRETPVRGPSDGVYQDLCRQDTQLIQGCDFARRDERFNEPTPFIPPDAVVWTNSDCVTECTVKTFCGYSEADSLQFRTGVAGRETRVNWIVTMAPPPPNTRVDDHAQDGVVLYWDNFSETVRDNRTRRFDFEGYRILRADNWTRPLGTSVRTGPPGELWRARFQADRINNFGDDTGLGALRYEPLTHALSPLRKRQLIDAIKQDLLAMPDENPPCPPRTTPTECDTLKALALWELGMEGGRQYYRFVDRSVHLGAPYFYAIVAFDHDFDDNGAMIEGTLGNPTSNFVFVEPQSVAQPAYAYDEDRVYVVPNPVTQQSMEGWALNPTGNDPSGVKLEFRHLPRTRGVIRIYTLAGDLVAALSFDTRNGAGTVPWDLVTRNGQSITSGVYLYAIEFEGGQFSRVVKKFTVIR